MLHYSSTYGGDPDLAALPPDFAPLGDASIQADLVAILAARMGIDRAAAEALLRNPVFEVLATSTYRKATKQTGYFDNEGNEGPERGRAAAMIDAARQAGVSMEEAVDGGIAAFAVTHDDWRAMLRRREARPSPFWRSTRFWARAGWATIFISGLFAFMSAAYGSYAPWVAMKRAGDYGAVVGAAFRVALTILPAVAVLLWLVDRWIAFIYSAVAPAIWRRSAALQFMEQFRNADLPLAEKRKRFRRKARGLLAALVGFGPLGLLFKPWMRFAASGMSLPEALETWSGAAAYAVATLPYIAFAFAWAWTALLLTGKPDALRRDAIALAEAATAGDREDS